MKNLEKETNIFQKADRYWYFSTSFGGEVGPYDNRCMAMEGSIHFDQALISEPNLVETVKLFLQSA